MKDIFFLPVATEDLRSIYKWYEEKKTGLGKEFLEVIFRQTEELQKGIINHRFFIEPVRFTKMNHFPFSIFYIRDAQMSRLVIIAVLGNKQDMLSLIKTRL